jgi:hypothetical protein
VGDNVPLGSLPPEETRLERLAAAAGVDAGWLRSYLYDQVELAEERWHRELFAAAGVEAGAPATLALDK